jgi:hypothetical protein
MGGAAARGDPANDATMERESLAALEVAHARTTDSRVRRW